MKERPSFEAVYMRLALSMSERSTCTRLSVGCAIVSKDFRQVFAVGYNGSASGGPNDCDRHGPEASGACGCLHAEVNACINCTASRRELKVVLCTHLPCVACSKTLINLGGVERLLYCHDYRVREGLDWFKRANILAESYSPPGSALETKLAEMVEEARNVATQAMVHTKAMHETLTGMQAQSTQLLLENRKLKEAAVERADVSVDPDRVVK